MAFTPADASEPLIRRLLAVYAAAEAQLLASLADNIARGIDTPDWLEQQTLRMARYRRHCEQILTALAEQSSQAVGDTLDMAARRGEAHALADLSTLLDTPVAEFTAAPIEQRAVLALARDLAGSLDGMRWPILRSTQDAYRQVIADVAHQVPLGLVPRRQAAQEALNRFAERGITGFVDRAGRRWEMESYVEMSTRASTMNAAVQGHLDRLQVNGMRLVMVSDVPQECEKCRPWEGKVLAVDAAGSGIVGAVGGGRPVRVDGTVDEARADGLLHPGCRHSLSAYIPGVTRSFGETADPQGDRDRQKLRYLERRVRAARRAELVALDEPARKKARARVRAGQARIREHVKTTTAKRQPQRERLGVR